MWLFFNAISSSHLTILTFLLQFWLLFSELWDINSQLRVIKSNSEEKLLFSYNCEFICRNSDFIRIVRCKLAIVRKKVRIVRYKVTIIFFIFLFSGGNGLPYWCFEPCWTADVCFFCLKTNVTLDRKTSHKGTFFEIEIYT